MFLPNGAELKHSAAQALDKAPNSKKIVMLWAGASGVLSLIITLINIFLESQIADTGGLSGIGLRSTLSTVQSVLSLMSTLLIPFWNLGYTSVVLRFSREENADVGSLLDGFRRFGPGLRLYLLRYGIYMAVLIAGIYAGSMLLSVTPLAVPLLNFMMEHEQAIMAGVIDDAIAMEMLKAAAPLLITCFLLSMILLIPLSYRLRLADLRIMDHPRCGAMMAMMYSQRVMRGNCVALLKLDLSFWWFYAAQLLVTLVNFGDLILPALGIPLPFDSNIAFYIFYIAALIIQFGVMYLMSNQVQTTYAKFYEALRSRPADHGSMQLA